MYIYKLASVNYFKSFIIEKSCMCIRANSQFKAIKRGWKWFFYKKHEYIKKNTEINDLIIYSIED